MNFKKVSIFIILVISMFTLNVSDIKATTLTFPEEINCTYSDYQNNKYILNRKYNSSSNKVINIVTKYDANDNKLEQKEITVPKELESGLMLNVTRQDEITTSCLKAVPGYVNLKYEKGEVKSSKQITKKIPTCQYSYDYEGVNYKITLTGTFTEETGHMPSLLKPSIKVEKNSNGKTQSLYPSTKGLEDYGYNCPAYAHYNPPGWTHQLVFSNSNDKPSGWNENLPMTLSVDLSTQENKVNELKNNINIRINSIKNNLNDINSKCLNINASNAKSELVILNNKIQTVKVDQASLEKLLNELDNIKLPNSKLLKDISDNDPYFNSYYPLARKHAEVITEVQEKYKSEKLSELEKQADDCLKNKLPALVNEGAISQETAASFTKDLNLMSEQSAKTNQTIINSNSDYGYSLEDYDCDDLGEIVDWIRKAFFIVQIVAVILVVVLGMLDFTKAVASSSDDAMKKAWKNLYMRLIILAVLILLPILIEFVLGLIDIPGLNNKDPLCR